MEQDTRKRKQRTVNMGLQYNLNAWLITVPEKGPLRYGQQGLLARQSYSCSIMHDV